MFLILVSVLAFASADVIAPNAPAAWDGEWWSSGGCPQNDASCCCMYNPITFYNNGSMMSATEDASKCGGTSLFVGSCTGTTVSSNVCTGTNKPGGSVSYTCTQDRSGVSCLVLGTGKCTSISLLVLSKTNAGMTLSSTGPFLVSILGVLLVWF